MLSPSNITSCLPILGGANRALGRGEFRPPHGALVSAARQGFSLTGRTIATLWVVLLASPQVLEAQASLTSGMAQVALVARVAPRGSIEGVTPHREIGRTST